MSARSIRGKSVMRLEYTTFVVALLVALSTACAVNAQPSEATGKQSEAQVVVESASAHSTSAIVKPEQAAEFPRSAALQRPGHVTVVSHQGFTAVPDSLRGSAK
jgi:hypothetical protein